MCLSREKKTIFEKIMPSKRNQKMCDIKQIHNKIEKRLFT